MTTKIQSRGAMRSILVELVDTGNLFAGAKVMAYTNGPPFVPTPLTTYADLDQPVTAGLAISSALVWGTPYIGADGDLHLTAPSHEFVATAIPASTETIYGYALVGDPSGSPFLIEIYALDSPVVISEKYDGFDATIDFVLPA